MSIIISFRQMSDVQQDQRLVSFDLETPRIATSSRTRKQWPIQGLKINLRERKGKAEPNVTSKSKKRRKPFKNGRWQADENSRYIKFLMDNEQIFEKRNVRRTGRIFKLMEKEIRTRTAIQCRSHHQKMEKKFQTLEEILEFVKKITDSSVGQTGTLSTDVPRKVSQPSEINEQQGSDNSDSVSVKDDSDIEEMPKVLQPSYKQSQTEEIRFFRFFKTQDSINGGPQVI